MLTLKNIIISILILLLACQLGYLNARRVNDSFFGIPPINDDEKFTEARKRLNKEIPLVKFDVVEKDFQDNSKIFIDARAEEEYKKGHIEDAILLPQHSLEKQLPEFLQKYPFNAPLLIYCGGLECSASIDLANQLYEAGYRNVEVYSGGWSEWKTRHQEKKK